MALKTPGRLNAPPAQATFDALPLDHWCGVLEGVYYRLHTLDAATGKPRPPVYFSQRGASRFDPADGPGTFYVRETLAGVLLEVFNDSWGPVNSTTRSLTQAQLDQWWVTLVALPPVNLFYAHGTNLSKIGTDIQLLAGDHAISREWALRLARHPLKIDGIFYPSRHQIAARNLAIFNQRGWSLPQFDKCLAPRRRYTRKIDPKGPIVYGPRVLLRHHPGLKRALIDLEVAILR
jgi:hypothetical protein